MAGLDKGIDFFDLARFFICSKFAANTVDTKNESNPITIFVCFYSKKTVKSLSNFIQKIC
jgi:hypothetical protein